MATSTHNHFQFLNNIPTTPPSLTAKGYRPDEMQNAAEALRATEVEAVLEDTRLDAESRYSRPLEDLSIDELRVLADALDVPNRGAITDSIKLVAEIRRRLLHADSWEVFHGH